MQNIHSKLLFSEKCSLCGKIFKDKYDNCGIFSSAELSFKWHTCFQNDEDYIYVWFTRLSENKDDIIILYIGHAKTNNLRFLHILLKFLAFQHRDTIGAETNRFMNILKLLLKNNLNICVARFSFGDVDSELGKTIFINESLCDLKQFLILNQVKSNRNQYESTLSDKSLYQNLINRIYSELRKMIYLERYIKFYSADLDYLLSSIDDEGEIFKKYISSFQNSKNTEKEVNSYFTPSSVFNVLHKKITNINKRNGKRFFTCSKEDINFQAPELNTGPRYFTKFIIPSTFSQEEIQIIKPKFIIKK